MAIFVILLRTIVMLICCVIQTVAVFVDGVSKLIGKIAEWMFALHDKVIELLNKGKRKTTDMDVPL